VSVERKAEQDAHEALRDTIRAAALATTDRRAADEPDDIDPEYRDGLATGVIVDYIVVAVFDNGSDVHDFAVVLRTDGKAAHYRMRGILATAFEDLG